MHRRCFCGIIKCRNKYTLSVFRFRGNERVLKYAFLVASVMFAVFHLAILNYVGFANNLFVAITTAITLIRGRKNKES